MTAQLQQLLSYLDREGVTELVIATSRSIAMRQNGKYVNLTARPMTLDMLTTLLEGTPISSLVPESDASTDPTDVDFGARRLRVRTGRRGDEVVVRVESTPKVGRAATRSRRRPSQHSAAPKAKPGPIVERNSTGGRTRTPESKKASVVELSPRQEVSLPTAPVDLSSFNTFTLDLPSVSMPSLEIEFDLDPVPQPLSAPDKASSSLSQLIATPPAPAPSASTLSAPPPLASAPPAPPHPTASSVHEVSPWPQSAPASPPQPTPTPFAQPVPSASLLPTSRPAPSALSTQFAKIVAAARAAGACDLHISAGRVVAVRQNAELTPLFPKAGVLTADEAAGLLMPLLASEHEARLQTVGYVDLAVEAPGGGRLRANISRHQVGLKGTFRLAIAAPKTLDELGLPKDVAKVVGHHQGFVVIAGPSGHGKTTTLAALVDLVNSTKAAHILLVEDPIEIEHRRKMSVISQREAGRHTKSFASALKASLREDPDVIVIGELRDRETVEIALTASETGHLVIATMSTPSAAKTLDRLIDMFPPEDHSQVRASIAGALRAIVAQRLLPAAAGGVVPAIELVTGVLPLAALIRDDKLYQLPNVMQRGRAFGMIRFDDSLAELVRAGKITEGTALAVAQDRKDLATRLKKGA